MCSLLPGPMPTREILPRGAKLTLEVSLFVLVGLERSVMFNPCNGNGGVFVIRATVFVFFYQ